MHSYPNFSFRLFWAILAVGICSGPIHGVERSPHTEQSLGRFSIGPKNSQRPRRADMHSPIQLASVVSADMNPETTYLDHESVTMGPLALENVGCESCVQHGSQHCSCGMVGQLFDWSRAEMWAGVTSFGGMSSMLPNGPNGLLQTAGQVEGNVGFQQGFNFGSRLPSLLGGQVGSQLGLRFTQSQLNGSAVGQDARSQLFLTAGLFRRVSLGLQGGLVVDYLHDDWIYQADILQLRGELSYLITPCHDFGFRFASSQQTDEVQVNVGGANLNLQLRALDTYRFFYRFPLGEDTRGRANLELGFHEESGVVLGFDIDQPLQNELGLRIAADYILPSESVTDTLRYQEESWNLSIGFVWTPGRRFGTARDFFRPLFDVADNGSLIGRHN